jgi:tetratricopeptide (TPR) repeat protein
MAQHALGRMPTHVEAHLALALLAFERGRYAEAARALSPALQTTPWHADGLALQGRLLVEAGDLDTARRCLRDAIERGVRSASAGRQLVTAQTLANTRTEPPVGSNARQPTEIDWLLAARPAVWHRDAAESDRLRSRVIARFFDGQPLVLALLDIVRGGVPSGLAGALFDRAQAIDSSGRARRILYAQLAAEIAALAGDRSFALRAIGLATRDGVDVNWLDRSVPLVAVRDQPEFTAIRAVVARRATEALDLLENTP